MTAVAEALSWGDAADKPPPSLAAPFRRPPRWIFHALVALPAVAVLYSVSFPGVAFFTGMAACFALLGAAALWIVRGITYLIARGRGRASGKPHWFLVAPVGGLMVALLIAGSVPLRARWALSESSFDDIVRDVRPTASTEDIVDLPVPGRIGSYDIRYAYRQGDAVIFYEETGALFDDAGFAYLPSGPFPELESGSFEAPQFRHLGGDWYAWTASW